MTPTEFLLARKWHSMSDHAADGTPFGGVLCNCISLAPRLAQMIAPDTTARAEADTEALNAEEA